jgi:hypothetical protein
MVVLNDTMDGIEERVTNGLSRYVLPVGEPVLLDDAGFLLPPKDPNWHVTPPVPITELAGFGAGFVLLTPGGAGKTVACQELAAIEGAEYVNAGPLDRSDFRKRSTVACVSLQKTLQLFP